jgi:hypothetical protein
MLLRGRTDSEKLQKIPFFWTFINSSVSASWISATSAIHSFLTRGTENNLAEINLESTGGDKGL